ncbi:hypothetical protein QJQ45_021473, partial [Haematococcus lacustris]
SRFFQRLPLPTSAMAAPSPTEPSALGFDGLPHFAHTTKQTFDKKESTVAELYKQVKGYTMRANYAIRISTVKELVVIVCLLCAKELDDEHSEHVVPEVARLAGAPYQTTLQELDTFLNSAWSSAMVRHANSILRTTRTVTVPGEPTVTYLADMDSRRAFWSVTAAEQVPCHCRLAVPHLGKSSRAVAFSPRIHCSGRAQLVCVDLHLPQRSSQLAKLVYVKANAQYETDTLAPPKDIRINIFE